MERSCDVAVVGGGLVGLATALALAESGRQAVTLIEAETRLASHQSGHNSGVIHAGLYDPPGSLRARLCAEGRRELVAFCQRHDVPWARPGKLVVASTPDQTARLAELEARGAANGLDDLRRLDQRELAGIEPRVAGLAALLVPSTGITDYRRVAAALAAEATRRGVRVLTGTRLVAAAPVDPDVAQLELHTSAGPLRCAHVVACAGLQADRVARLLGAESDVVIVPFRGSYRRLACAEGAPVRHLVYPVPDPRLPFLGVHVTPTIGGEVEVGPDATLAWSRHGYARGALDARDAWELLSSRGARRLVARLWRTGLAEWRRAGSSRLTLAAVRRLLPRTRAEELLPAGSGVRAQAVGPDGALLRDFVLARGPRSLHVLNAPSPAATASLAIGRHVAQAARHAFGI